ncbi:MAG: transcriptional repressor LexA [Limnochordia bacterium]|jgi:repressor LexA|nr:transcriptional repressor LexA [Bacillota bacterium]NLL07889.1 transcriptional repressor LexA [Bacillota bacterium]HBG08736.1 repressor LexA [Bacillota bacterium]
MAKLSDRQQRILEFIRSEVATKGYPPSVREIGNAVGLRSSSTVHGHLTKLEELGYIRRDLSKPRAIELLDDSLPSRTRVIDVPLVGKVTAGAPVLAVENIEDYFPIPKDFVEHEDVFMLRVKGDSMVDAGILDGDFVLVNRQETAFNGEIVVALIDGEEATVKRFFHEGTHIRLQPENAAMDPLIVEDVRILGKVIGVFRRIH